MHPEDDLDKAEKFGRVITLNKLVHNLLSTLISEIQCFTLKPFKVRHLSTGTDILLVHVHDI
jgi:hypothetical protein